MTPDEWQTGIQNEAAQAGDALWAAEARRYVGTQRWLSALHSFLLGLLIVQLGVALVELRGIVVLRLDGWDRAGGMFWNLAEDMVIAGALLAAVLLGWRGAQAWAIALAFALTLMALSWTDAAVGLLSPPLRIGWAFGSLGTGGLVLATTLQVLLAYIAVTLGRRLYRPRRLA